MKKFISHVCGTLAVLCGLYLLAPQVGSAQNIPYSFSCPDSPPDFPERVFVQGTAIQIEDPNCPGCFFTVQWCFRCIPQPAGVNNTFIVDIYIGDITYPQCAVPCQTSTDFKVIMNLAFKAAILQVPCLNVQACPDNNNTIWRYFPGSCRRQPFWSPIHGLYLVPVCSPFTCWATYTACWKLVNGEVTTVLTKTGEFTSPDICTGGTIEDPCTQDCPNFDF